MADNINSTNPSDIATRAQVEREIADWLRRIAEELNARSKKADSMGYSDLADSWSEQATLQSVLGRSIQRGEYRKDKA